MVRRVLSSKTSVFNDITEFVLNDIALPMTLLVDMEYRFDVCNNTLD